MGAKLLSNTDNIREDYLEDRDGRTARGGGGGTRGSPEVGLVDAPVLTRPEIEVFLSALRMALVPEEGDVSFLKDVPRLERGGSLPSDQYDTSAGSPAFA